MPVLLGIYGSVTGPGRLLRVLETGLDMVREGHGDLSVQLLDLGAHEISFADGRPLSEYPDDTGSVVQRVVSADMYLIATPVYRASFTGALKNLLDLVPVEGLMGKACGLLAMGASDRHYLATDTQLRPVMAWFGAHLVPGALYLQSSQFSEGLLIDTRAVDSLKRLVDGVIATHRAIAGADSTTGPPPLAAGTG